MLKILKAAVRLTVFLAGLTLFLIVTSPEKTSVLAFSPITGLMEAYSEAEKTALGMIPDGIEDLVKRLSSAIKKAL